MLYSLLLFPMDMSLLSHASSLKVSRVRLLTIVAFIGWSVPSVAFHSFATPTLSKSAVNSVALFLDTEWSACLLFLLYMKLIHVMFC